jgi:hypothetical protein
MVLTGSSVASNQLTAFVRCYLLRGCQMVYFKNQKYQFGKILDRKYWKMLIHFMAIWNIYGYLRYFRTNWYILCAFGTFFPVLVSWTRENLATLIFSRR